MSAVGFLAATPVFTTRQFALACEKRIDSASRLLAGYERSGSIVRVTRGVWAQPGHPQFTPYGLVPLLLDGERGCVSFLTALHLHGVVSQIPDAIQIATTGHARTLATPVATFQFLQLKPQMMQMGIELHPGLTPFPLASAEKALLDTLYVATRRGRRFARLPELELDLLRPRLFRCMLVELVTAPAPYQAICRRLEALAPALLPRPGSTR